MKKTFLITALLFALYSPANAQTFKPTYEHKLQSSVPKVMTHKQSSEKLKELYKLAYGGDYQTLESICEFFGLIGIVYNAVEEYQSKEVKRLNALQKLTQYLVGLKMKADKFKKYFKWEF